MARLVTGTDTVMASRVLIATIVGLATLAAPAPAQSPQTVTVRGIAYDSLHAMPLTGAFIVISGTGRSATSDSAGRFVFDSVVPGSYRFVMQHDALDSVGMSGVATRAIVTDGRDTVRVSVPSFASMWRAACPSSQPPADSGLIFGTVRAAPGARLLTSVRVNASWIDLGYEQSAGVTQHRWRFEAAIDSLGNYTLCGVPLLTGIRLWATADSSSTRPIDLLPLEKSWIARRDLLLRSIGSDSMPHGTIDGVVTGDGGSPLRDAIVITEGVPNVRTDKDGHFVVRGVPTGTQQIEVRAIGLSPVFKSVDVPPKDTAYVAISLEKVTVLDSVRATASTVRQRIVAEFEERRKVGIGKFVDSTTIAKHGTIVAIFGEMPSVTVVPPRRGAQAQLVLPSGAGKCLATLYVDRVKTDQADLADYRPEDIAAIEVYARPFDVPIELMSSMQMATGAASMRCGVIVIWTKRGLGG